MHSKYLALMIVLTVCGCGLVSPVFAFSDSDVAIISCNPLTAIDIVIGGEIDNWTLSNVGHNIDDTSLNMTIRANTDWAVVVKDALNDDKPADSVGNMTEWIIGEMKYADDPRWLLTPIKIATSTSPYVSLTGDEQLLTQGSNTPVGGFLFPLRVNQFLRLADDRLQTGETYRIVVTFIANNL